ncbi:coproporphyrinogen-III oxidase family protein [Desulfosporosinus sp. PR]|uniref:coproporphyrinogen-III oxidase family protein n=1 Tax=Candidatus Desulfosporosinus nitrosoreducens TaxID=3401928 RepID=UPI0027E6A416|nr:coproporphyrinogen-III oxidase family protein [Desulfosporosinus sp. PR]MDQ7093261.1 coproporphyrinogen-III oxidase family protein [Desulfosporosinus sp. PR]
MLTQLLKLIVAHKWGKYVFEPYREGDIDFTLVPEELGLYIHVPFCQKICHFCPYNRTLYKLEQAERYCKALLKELGLHKPFLQGKKIDSIYFGGGTPTLIADQLTELLDKLRMDINFSGDVGIEVHPREGVKEKFQELRKTGINQVSIGVQSFNSEALNFLERGYGAEECHQAVQLAMQAGFTTVDVDLMYNIPGQTIAGMERDLHLCMSYGVDQISMYPLIVFPLTPLQDCIKASGRHRFGEFQEFGIQKRLDRLAREYGYQRTSIWTYAKKGAKRYTSVTRERFLGLGASAASLYSKYFYLNTFNVAEYIEALENGRTSISLVNQMSDREQQVFWLFWRCYDTNISRQRFSELFGKSLDKEFRLMVSGLKTLGLAKDQEDDLKLTQLGSFCYHFVEKQYSLRYLNNLWDASRQEPWPKRLEL